jgi:N-acetylmuramoyl-L-alanine amidase
VHQAGFFVLVGASMPAMLLELGYLSNESDVDHLTDEAEQTRLAKGIFEGIREYEKIYSASLK